MTHRILIRQMLDALSITATSSATQRTAMTAARAYLTELEKSEPVGYLYIEATYPEGDLRGRGWKFHQFSRSKPNRPWMQRDVVPLYDHPAPQPTELSDEEIMALDCVSLERMDYEVFEVDKASVLEFARAVLAAARSKT